MEAIKKVYHLNLDQAGLSERINSNQTPFMQRLVQAGFSSFGRIFPNTAAKLAFRFFSTPRHRARHKISDPILERARLFELLYGGQILKAYEWGRGEKTVLLVHGWESRGTALRSFVPPLVEMGYRVVAFDGPAHGNSGGKRTNLPHFGGAVRAVINHLGGVYGMICHSFGGASTVFALWNIDPRIQVEKLVLLAVPNRMSHVIASAAKSMNLPRVVTRKFKSIIEEKLNLPIEAANLENAYGKIKVTDALIVHDKADPVVPFSGSRALFEAWDNASMIVTEGLGHYRLIKHPELVGSVTRFMHQE